MDYSGKMFITMKEAAKITGVPYGQLRRGCHAGTVPYIQSGQRFLINMPALIEQLNRESKKERKTTA